MRTASWNLTVPPQPDLDSAILIESGGVSPNELRMTLNECNLNVFIAANEDEAIDCARAILARLVVLLYRSASGRRGLYTCAEIRGLPRYASVPILLLGPALDLATRDLAAEVGVSTLLTMPISTLALQQAVRPLVGLPPLEPAMAMEWPRGSAVRRTNWAHRRRLS